MLEIDIATIDPMQHQPKIFLGLTRRQCLCLVPGVVMGAATFYLVQKNIGSIDVSFICCALVLAPFILFGYVRPYNMPFEKYLQLMIQNRYVNSSKRIFKTEAMIVEEEKLEEQRKETSKSSKSRTSKKSQSKKRKGRRKEDKR